MGVSSISSGFPLLSRSSGQVPHVLLTRSPLGLHRYCYRMDLVRLACMKHAASVRPEPGSNSPSRNADDPYGSPVNLRESVLDQPAAEDQLALDSCYPSSAILLTRSTSGDANAPARAFGFLCSVFKEHSADAHTPMGRRCLCYFGWPGAAGGCCVPAGPIRYQVPLRAASELTLSARVCQGIALSGSERGGSEAEGTVAAGDAIAVRCRWARSPR